MRKLGFWLLVSSLSFFVLPLMTVACSDDSEDQGDGKGEEVVNRGDKNSGKDDAGNDDEDLPPAHDNDWQTAQEDQFDTPYTIKCDTIFKINDVAFGMIHVAPGSYMMGANDGDALAQEDEKPALLTYVQDFYIGQVEVTQKLWKAVMGTNPSWHGGLLPARSGVNTDRLPAEHMTASQMKEFVDALNDYFGLKAEMANNTWYFDLPYESEWEYAARGGKSSKGYLYSGSNDPSSVAWCMFNSADYPIDESDWSWDEVEPDDDSGCKSHEVATKKPNELGIYDMSGNVSELCNSSYKSYKTGEPMYSVPYGVCRGGSFYTVSSDARVSAREEYSKAMDFYGSNTGLRIVLRYSPRVIY